jgi:hypothetical protein
LLMPGAIKISHASIKREAERLKREAELERRVEV